MSKIRVAVVEDDPDWVQILTDFLKGTEDFETSWVARSREEALAKARSSEIDVLLMDISLNGRPDEGIFTVLDILLVKPVKIVMLTSLREEKIIRDAYTAGALDYIFKDDIQDLPFVIRRVYHRNASTEVLLKEFQRLKREEQLIPLTPSERDLFRHMEEGFTLSQIGKRVFKAQNTLKQQTRSILKKLKVHSRKEAIRKVNSGGLTDNTDKD